MHSRLQSGRLAKKLREHTALAAIAQWSRREGRDKQLYWQVAGWLRDVDARREYDDWGRRCVR
jgi:hypothetical protein